MLHDHHGGWSSIVFPFPCPSTASCGEKGSPAASCERSSRSSCERFEGAPGLGNLEDKGVEEAMPKKNDDIAYNNIITYYIIILIIIINLL